MSDFKSLLKSLLSPDNSTRTTAESQMSSLWSSEGTLKKLLAYISDPEVGHAAAVQLKAVISMNWRYLSKVHAEDMVSFYITLGGDGTCDRQYGCYRVG
jgi:ferric iron reductase protein FhuF